MCPEQDIKFIRKIHENMKKVIVASAALFLSSLMADAQVYGEDTYIHTDMVGSEVRQELIIP